MGHHHLGCSDTSNGWHTDPRQHCGSTCHAVSIEGLQRLTLPMSCTLAMYTSNGCRPPDTVPPQWHLRHLYTLSHELPSYHLSPAACPPPPPLTCSTLRLLATRGGSAFLAGWPCLRARQPFTRLGPDDREQVLQGWRDSNNPGLQGVSGCHPNASQP